MKKCRWIEDEGNNWETDCGKSWEFHYDGPEENEVKYCPFCGKLVEAKYVVDSVVESIDSFNETVPELEDIESFWKGE